jgi:antitoxin CcdA
MTFLARERAIAYDRGAPKRAAIVTVSSDLLRPARALEVNLSQTLENALAHEVCERERERWLSENRPAIEAYNREVESRGCFADLQRSF